MSLSGWERRVVDEIERRRDDLVALASDLIGFNTTARNVGDPPRQEAALQHHLAARLRRAGAEVDLFEPDAEAMRGKPLVPSGLDFTGRPQLLARRRGMGVGRTLLFNGHIDVVPAAPLERWASDPFAAELRDGLLYGRGACDMKGGIAAMVLTTEVLAEVGVELAGDLVVATNTDEESSGAGGVALVEHGLRADAAIVVEPTSFNVWVTCRGSEYATVRIPGRAGHAEVNQPDWQEGGPVNAIEKATVAIDAIRALRADWATRDGLAHPYVSRPTLLPTLAAAGEWPVTYPAECTLTLAVMYVPAQADEHGGGSLVRREVEEWLRRETAKDDWLAEHPPVVEWDPDPVMPFEVAESEPIVRIVYEATRSVGRTGRLSGLDSWYDGATFTRLAGIPSVGFGPPDREPGGRVSRAHGIDECVPVDGLVGCAQALAVAAMRFCGTA